MLAVPLESKYTVNQDGFRALNGVCLIWKMTHPRSEKTEQTRLRCATPWQDSRIGSKRRVD